MRPVFKNLEYCSSQPDMSMLHRLPPLVRRLPPTMPSSPRTVCTSSLQLTHGVASTGLLVPDSSLLHPVLEQWVPPNISTRTLLLNRPRALHALSEPMCSALHARLHTLANLGTRCVVLAAHGTPARAFCAGGDVRAVYDHGAAGRFEDGDDLFRIEFRMNSLLARMRPAAVAILDGIVMGGGAGLSVHGKYRVATSNTVFAMPECAIALSPDVGASYFLSRLEQPGLGMYLALTGARLKGGQVKEAGLATHFVSPEGVHELISRLQASELPDEAAIGAVLKEFEVDTGPDGQLDGLDVIRRSFTRDSVASILGALNDIVKDGTEQESTFASSTVALIRKQCPTSLKIAFQAQTRGASLSVDDCLRMEFRIVTRCLRRDDFYTGVKSALVTKDRNPIWNPANIDDVSDEAVEKFFDPLENDLRIPELELGEAQSEEVAKPFRPRLNSRL